MIDIDNGGQAFPCLDSGGTGMLMLREPGMTLRDYFAAKAMAALIAEPPWGEHSESTTTVWGQDFRGPPDERKTAFVAYKVADAMLAAREKGGA